jgi:pimeloyl-ACP methyl ester carboxylesterase
MRRCNALLTTIVVALASGGSLCAQTVPVLMVHGAWSTGGVWAGLVDLLNDGSYTTSAPSIDWTQPFASEASVVAPILASSGSNTVMVGHSQGGLITRLSTRSAPAFGAITIGTPHAGLPIINFGWTLLEDIGTIDAEYALAAGNIPLYCENYPADVVCTDTPSWGDWLTAGSSLILIALDAVGNYIAGSYPDYTDLAPGSAAMTDLANNYGSEQALHKLAITVDVGDEWAGPFRLIRNPPDAEADANTANTAGATLYFLGDEIEFTINADDDINYGEDLQTAESLQDMGAFVAGFCDEIYNWQYVGSEPNDALVTTFSQGAWPGADPIRMNEYASHNEEPSMAVFLKQQIVNMTGRP